MFYQIVNVLTGKRQASLW